MSPRVKGRRHRVWMPRQSIARQRSYRGTRRSLPQLQQHLPTITIGCRIPTKQSITLFLRQSNLGWLELANTLEKSTKKANLWMEDPFWIRPSVNQFFSFVLRVQREPGADHAIANQFIHIWQVSAITHVLTEIGSPVLLVSSDDGSEVLIWVEQLNSTRSKICALSSWRSLLWDQNFPGTCPSWLLRMPHSLHHVLPIVTGKHSLSPLFTYLELHVECHVLCLCHQSIICSGDQSKDDFLVRRPLANDMQPNVRILHVFDNFPPSLL